MQLLKSCLNYEQRNTVEFCNKMNENKAEEKMGMKVWKCATKWELHSLSLINKTCLEYWQSHRLAYRTNWDFCSQMILFVYIEAEFSICWSTHLVDSNDSKYVWFISCYSRCLHFQYCWRTVFFQLLFSPPDHPYQLCRTN